MTWEPLNLASPTYALEPDPPQPDFGGLFYAHKRHVVSAPTESLKTLCVLAVVVDALRAGRRVGIVDFEMGPHATRRLLDDLGATLDEIARIYYVQPDGPPTDADLEAVSNWGLDLVVIDASLGAFHASGLDDNKRADVEKFAAQWIEPLYARGIATVVLDHVTKSSDNRGKFTIGSERKVGQVDVHLGLEVEGTPLTRGGSGTVKVRVHKDRPGYLTRPYTASIEFASEPDTHALTWGIKHTATSDVDWRPTILIERAYRFLKEQSEPVSRNTVVAAIGKNKQKCLQAIEILVAEGTATPIDGPRGAKLVILTDRYSGSGTSPGTGEPVTGTPVHPPTGGTGAGTGQDAGTTEAVNQ